MKRITTKCLLALGIALGISLCAQAQSLSYPLSSGAVPAGFTSTWLSSAASDNPAVGAIQANYSGNTWNSSAQIDFGTAASQNGNANANVDINNMLNTYGFVQVSFNLIVDDWTTYPLGTPNWSQFQLQANSASGGGGWTATPAFTMPSYNGTDSGVQTYARSYTSTQLGWTSLAGNWFQLIFVGNSNPDTFRFYINDLTITPVPEPTSLALAGLGAAALLIFRRRK